MKNIIFLFFCFAILSSCNRTRPSQTEGDHLGELHFSYVGNADAMPHFEKGLKLLHNFEYEDAATEFIKAQELDSSFVMAYWGEAMTYNHPLWRQQDKDKARIALAKLAPSQNERLKKAANKLEHDFLESIETLYGEGEKNERDVAYSAYLEKMHNEYPDNEEVVAFYALSILGAVPVGRDDAAYEKSATVVKGLLAENPNHPGGLHYLIHSYDDPYHAKMALDAAHSYSKVAADATHALHMPSHIFLAVGMWDEVVVSNVASYEASVRRMEEKKLGNSARSYHAFSWLQYGYLQQGKTEEARRIMLDMKKYMDELPVESARNYFVSMKGNFLLSTGEWTGEIADYQVDVSDLGIVSRSQNAFIEGMKCFVKKEADSLAVLIADMEKERKKAMNLVSDKGIPMCSANGDGKAPNQLDIDWSQVMEMELRALHARLRYDEKEAEKWLTAATALESSISYDYGPPSILKPSHEMYGEWLLEQNRPKEALAQFEVALLRAPNRWMSEVGKSAAEQKAGQL